LARALLANAQYKDVIKEFANIEFANPAASAEVKTHLAYAHEYLGQSSQAQEAIAAAQKFVPNHPATLLLMARIAGYQRQGDLAMDLMDKALSTTPKDPYAWFQKGELLVLVRNDHVGAGNAFRKSLELRPAFHDARYALIALLINSRDLKGASEQIEALNKLRPNHPITKFFEAQVSLMKGDTQVALEAIELAQKSIQNSAGVLQLAGEIQYSSGNLLQAEKSFSQALNVNPINPIVRRQLARVQMRLDQPLKALDVLKPLLSAKEVDVQAYILAGEAQLQAGRKEQARAYLEKVVEIDPNNAVVLTQLAILKQDPARLEATVKELQRIATISKDTSADLALVATLIQLKSFDRAFKAIDGLEVKLPKNPLPVNLRGNVQLLQGNAEEARTSFERALQLDARFVPAASSLANLDLRENNVSAAKKRFESVLESDPKNLDALVSLIKLRRLEGAPDSEISTRLTRAIQLNPSEAAPRLMLIDHQLQAQEHKAALISAQEANAKMPNNADIVEALGRAQLANGDVQQAITSFGKLVGLEPRSNRSFMRLAAAQLVKGANQEAEQSLNRALALSPDYLPAQQALIKLALAEKKYDAALSISRAVQQQRKTETTGYDLEAEVEYARGNREAAVEVYRSALKKHPVSIFAVKLHGALKRNQQESEAASMAAVWMKDHPRDAGFLAYLGDVAMLQKQFADAELHYRQVVALQPRSADALNNIANALIKQSKPGATDFAERAVQIRPNDPGLMDTLAASHAAEKRFQQAISVQKQALTLAPGDQMLHLNMAKILVQAGDRKAALEKLQELEKLGSKFQGHAEVGALLKTLRS